jgi:hypothetical protein
LSTVPGDQFKGCHVSTVEIVQVAPKVSIERGDVAGRQAAALAIAWSARG